MNKFPQKNQYNLTDFLSDYVTHLSDAVRAVDTERLQSAFDAVREAIENDSTVFFCGNGGSAAIADHFVCDYVKGMSTDTSLKPKFYSLNSNIAF